MSSLRHQRAFCIGCGRPLESVRQRCSNCGRAYSICDRASWAPTPWQGRMRRVFTGPPNAVDMGLAAATAFMTLLAFAAPGRFAVLFQLAVLLWIATVSVWLLRLFDRVTDHYGERSTMARTAFMTRMAAPPVILAGALWLVAAHLPVRLGFMLSRGEFERVAQRLPGEPESRFRAGLYLLTTRVNTGDPYSPLVHLSAAGDALAEDRQFVYAPGGAEVTDPRYVPLSGNWYIFRAAQ